MPNTRTAQQNMILVLNVSLEGSTLKVSAFEKEQGEEQTLRHDLDHQISETTLKKYTAELIDCLNKVNNRGRLSDESLNDLKKYGQRLFDSLLPTTVKLLVSSSTAEDLIVHMNDLLVDVPWELLFDGKDFLSLRFNMGRVVSTKQPVHAKPSRLSQGSLRMWVIADPKGDLEHAYQEGVELRNALDRHKKAINIDLKTSSVDSEAFKLHIRDYDILHYAGHAYYDKNSPEKSGFLLEGSVFSARDALELVGERSLPALVFSNACQSGYSDAWHFERESSQKVYGMANAFLLAGVRHFIGTLFRVGDKESKDFARYFYEQLLAGNSIGSALKQARLKMVKQHGYESLGWAGYVCYGDPTYTLFGSSIGTKTNLMTSKNRVRFNKWLAIIVSLCVVILFSTFITAPHSFGLYHKTRIKMTIAVARALNKYYLLVESYIQLGNLFLSEGNFKKAGASYEEALYLAEVSNNEHGLSHVHIALSNFNSVLGRQHKAIELLNIELDKSRRTHSSEAEAYLLRLLGMRFTDLGKFDQAKNYFDQALEIQKKLGRSSMDYDASWAYLELSQGNYEKALEYTKTVLNFTEKSERTINQYFTFCDLGAIYFSLGNNKEAEVWLLKALDVSKHQKYPTVFYGLSVLEQAEGEFEAALNNIRKVIAMSEKNGHKRSIGIAMVQEADILTDLNQLNLAEVNCRNGLDILQKETDDTCGLMKAYNTLARIYLKKNMLNDAELMSRKIYELYQNAPFRAPYEQYLLTLGEIRVAQGRKTDALSLYAKGLELEKLSPSEYTPEFKKRLQSLQVSS